MNQHPSLPALRRLLPWLGLLAAALLACGPFLSGGVWHGSDLGYHLRRIENIAMGLADGQFPVRIQSDWLLGNGYAVGVFYGDLLLYAPALLRLAGVPVTIAYDLYLFAVTLLTAWGGYYAARRLALPRAAAFGAAALYTLAAYRLCDVTDRAALGEYTALAFLPLAAAGFWRTLHPDSARLPGAALLVLGLSGVLQSHLLSFEMTVLCLCAAALVLARATFRRAVPPRAYRASQGKRLLDSARQNAPAATAPRQAAAGIPARRRTSFQTAAPAASAAPSSSAGPGVRAMSATRSCCCPAARVYPTPSSWPRAAPFCWIGSTPPGWLIWNLPVR